MDISIIKGKKDTYDIGTLISSQVEVLGKWDRSVKSNWLIIKEGALCYLDILYRPIMLFSNILSFFERLFMKSTPLFHLSLICWSDLIVPEKGSFKTSFV